MFHAGKYKIKYFIVFYLQFNMKQHAFLSHLVKHSVKISSFISLVDFIYLILEGMNSLLSVVFIGNYF